MFKRLLISLGLMTAPRRPSRKYARYSPIALLPVLGFVAWRNRAYVKGLFQRGQSAQLGARAESSLR